ncbi:MAG TPA: GNAT family N-acetyltransferase [Rubricoccaceae bacterium]|jgi:GNAT superfamily N-acetyltransferase
MEISRAHTVPDFDVARALFQEYAAGLGVDLCFQGFDAELAALDRVYTPPAGALLLAFDGDTAAGCVAVRPAPAAGAGTCEMKRLYVRPAYRGTGLGRRLAEAVVEEGRRLGYTRMVLDTLETMDRARAVYAALGFRETAPYYPNPLDGVRYLEADL